MSDSPPENVPTIINLVRDLAGPRPKDVSRMLSAASEEELSRTPRKWWFWTVLLIACFLPRLLLSLQMPGYCNDAYYYIYLADQITKGDVSPLIEHFGINLYPLILVAGHALGFTWGAAGVIWGILMGSLTILPLYGWLRRIGNEHVALAGSFLYASQPKFIEISVEPIRDPTFWFLFALALYFTWRMIEALQLRWFLATGVVLALAVHTRTEGWLLLIPVFLWLLVMGCESPRCRWKIALGSPAMLSMIPLFAVIINLTLYQNEPEWQLGKLQHFATCWNWVESQVSEAPAVPLAVETPAPALPAAAQAPESPQTGAMSAFLPNSTGKSNMRIFLHQLHSTLEPLHLLLILLGASRCWGLVWGRRFLPLVLVATLVCVAIWIWISKFGMSNGRYFLTAYLATLPLEALGLLGLLGWIQQHRNVFSPTESSGYRWVTFTLGLMLVVGWGDAFIRRESRRKDELALVGWLRSSRYAQARLSIDAEAKRIGYHFCGEMPPVMDNPWNLPNPENYQPQLVIVSKSCLPPEQRAAYLQHLASRNYRIIPVPEFPMSHHLWVLVSEVPPPNCQKSHAVAQTPVRSGNAVQ